MCICEHKHKCVTSFSVRYWYKTLYWSLTMHFCLIRTPQNLNSNSLETIRLDSLILSSVFWGWHFTARLIVSHTPKQQSSQGRGEGVFGGFTDKPMSLGIVWVLFVILLFQQFSSFDLDASLQLALFTRIKTALHTWEGFNPSKKDFFVLWLFPSEKDPPIRRRPALPPEPWAG